MTDLIGGSNLLGNKSGRPGSLLELVVVENWPRRLGVRATRRREII
jgi:hypothetical protein